MEAAPTSPVPSEHPVRTGVLVAGRYLVHERIGAGGMAEVFRAADTKLGREVALKVLLPGDDDPHAARRMMKEARTAAVFQHPNSVTVFDAGEHEGAPFIAMELVRGATLSALVRAGDVPVPRTLRWLCTVARVLAAAHAAGVIHRDVKPSNVLIREDGEAKVLDFGIAQGAARTPASDDTRRLTPAGALIGTPGYVAPEILLGEAASAKSDQFSWGVMAYELLAGRRPYRADDIASLIARMLCDPPPPLASEARGVPPEVCAVVDRALSRSPADRFASLDEVADRLLPHADITGPLAASSTSTPRATPVTGDETRPLSAPVTRREVTDGPRPATASAADERHPRAGARRAALVIVALVIAAAAIGLVAQRWPAPSPPAAEAEVRSLGCAPATVTGAADDEELVRVVGFAACARLAVELGIPWGTEGPSHDLDVRAELAEGATRVTLALAGHEAHAEAAAPIQAIDAAVAALAGEVSTPRWSAAEIRAWGADDEAGARRIARVFRRRDLRLSPDINAEVLRLLETDPGSPFSHVLPLMIVGGSRDVIQGARERTLALLDRLPSSRAHLLHGLVLLFPSVLDHDEGVRLLRQSYAEAPDDAEMVGLYASLAIRLGLPEAHAVFERLIERAPGRTVAAFDQALIWAAENDPDRDARYAERLLAVHPEARASPPIIRYFLRTDQLAEAERAVALGERLGVGDVHRTAAVEVALAAGRMDEARRHAQALLGAPAPLLNLQGAEVLVTTLFREGRVDEALTTFSGVEQLGVDGGWAGGTARLVVRELCARRWLQRPGASPAIVDWLARAVDSPAELTGAARAEARVQLALASRAPPAELAALLADIEAEAAAADTPFARDDLLAVRVPLVRVVRGDRAAATAWATAGRARIAFKIRACVDAGLAFERIGDADGAARALAVAFAPAALRESGLERVIAADRLSRVDVPPGTLLLPGTLRAELDALARTADRGLLDALRRIE